VRQIEMAEYPGYDRRIGEAGDDRHGAATCGTPEGKHLEDAGEELSPADTSRRRGALTRVVVEAAGAYLWIRRLRLGCRNLRFRCRDPSSVFGGSKTSGPHSDRTSD
jgi:hypothetical protein